MENLNGFYKELYSVLQKEEMPAEVELFINMAKNKIKSIYKCEDVLDSTLEEFIDTQFDGVKPNLDKMQEDKKQSDFGKIYSVISGISKKNDDNNDNNFIEAGKQGIEAIQTKEESTKNSKRIVDVVGEVVENIQDKAKSLSLGDEDLNYTIDKFKSYISTQIPQDLKPSFEKNYHNSLKLVSEKFEEYYKENGREGIEFDIEEKLNDNSNAEA